MCVLIVDDERAYRAYLRAVLVEQDIYEVLEAGDGIEAQEVLREHSVQVAITDMRMPRLDGLGLVAWAKDHAPHTVWIVTSVRHDFEAAVEAIEHGVFAFLPKPLPSLEDLHMTVANALTRNQLLAEQARLRRDLETSNLRLQDKVEQLQNVCRVHNRQALRIQSDLERAQQIQRALLPASAPTMHRFAIDALYRPSHLVGGDLYDVKRVDRDRVIVYIADAAGHGISAAMLSVLFKNRVRMADERTGEPLSPATVLQAANRALLPECRSQGLFLTLAYAVLDTRTRELIFASAGHPPALLLRAGSGAVERVERTGPALGLERRAAYDERTIRMNAGDRLLLYTDGIFEERGGVTPEQLADRLAEAQGSGQVLLGSLGQPLAGDVGPDDDVTLLLLSADEHESQLDNGAAQGSAARDPESDGEILLGRLHEQDVVVVRGRGLWLHSHAFSRACHAAMEQGRALTVDLSACRHVDSTFLGTLHEIVLDAERRKASLHIQGVSEKVTETFRELELERVLARVGPTIAPPLHNLRVLQSARHDSEEARRRILRAHELLSSVSPANAAEFGPVIEALRAELAVATTAPGDFDTPPSPDE